MKENILIAALIAALGVAIAVVAKLGALIPWLMAISLGAAFCKGLEIFCDWYDERQARKPSGKQAALTADHGFARPADIVLSFDRHGRRGVSFRDASGTDDFPAVLVTVDALPRNRHQSPPEVAIELFVQLPDLAPLLQPHYNKLRNREHEQGKQNRDETPAKQPKTAAARRAPAGIGTDVNPRNRDNGPARQIEFRTRIDGTMAVQTVVPDTKRKTLFITSTRIEKRKDEHL